MNFLSILLFREVFVVLFELSSPLYKEQGILVLLNTYLRLVFCISPASPFLPDAKGCFLV